MGKINIYAKEGICFRILEDEVLEGELNNKMYIEYNMESIILYIETTYKLNQFSHYALDEDTDTFYLYFSDNTSKDILVTSLDNNDGMPELYIGECLYITEDIADKLNELDKYGSNNFLEGDEVYIKDKSKKLKYDYDINYYLKTDLISSCRDEIKISDIVNFVSDLYQTSKLNSQDEKEGRNGINLEKYS